MSQNEVDITLLIIQLNRLKSEFDAKIREGDTFENVKKLYIEIKEIETSLKGVAWNEQ